ncbi:hypothetical protein Tco_0908539 [Tanacetum coccineum]|uniref:Uncharacterized protein n=1 Tax=Tanacetum coccineum TaxID=301880 RepID=A0ABQ5CNI8_9ASTR
MTARISIRDEPSISLPPREEVERLLALTTLPHNPYYSTIFSITTDTINHHYLYLYHHPIGTYSYEIPESCLPLGRGAFCSSPTPSVSRVESRSGAARQDRPTIARDDPYSIAREDLYGFVDVVDVPPRCSTSRELDYDITDTWDDLVGAINENCTTTFEEVNQRVYRSATIIEEETY